MRIRALIALMLTGLLLVLSACGQAEQEETRATTTTEATALTTTVRLAQPLPENCRLIQITDKEDANIRNTKQTTPLNGNLIKGKSFLPQRTEDDAPVLVMRDNKTGEESVVAYGMSGNPYVLLEIDKRYIVWAEYFKANDYHGIYDTQEKRNISLDAGGYIHYMRDGYLYAIPPINYGHWGPLSVRRTSLAGLSKKDHVAWDKDLLIDLPEAALRNPDERLLVSDLTLSPDIKYYAVLVQEMGLYIYDLTVPRLVLFLPEDAMPNEMLCEDGRSPTNLMFVDRHTLYCYHGYYDVPAVPYLIEINLS